MEAVLGESETVKQIVTENTFILEPEGYGEVANLKQSKVHALIREALDQKLEGQAYDPLKAAQRAKQLADDVKERVKGLGNTRHKIVVQVNLGQKRGQAMRVTSRCLWDTNTDTAVSCTFENETMYCICQVYGVFVE